MDGVSLPSRPRQKIEKILIKACFLSVFFIFTGASGGSRTLILSLENLYTNRCTTLANVGRDIGIEPTTFWTTIRRSNQLS